MQVKCESQTEWISKTKENARIYSRRSRMTRFQTLFSSKAPLLTRFRKRINHRTIHLLWTNPLAFSLGSLLDRFLFHSKLGIGFWKEA